MGFQAQGAPPLGVVIEDGHRSLPRLRGLRWLRRAGSSTGAEVLTGLAGDVSPPAGLGAVVGRTGAFGAFGGVEHLACLRACRRQDCELSSSVGGSYAIKMGAQHRPEGVHHTLPRQPPPIVLPSTSVDGKQGHGEEGNSGRRSGIPLDQERHRGGPGYKLPGLLQQTVLSFRKRTANCALSWIYRA